MIKITQTGTARVGRQLVWLFKGGTSR